jgi:hypothetical protein
VTSIVWKVVVNIGEPLPLLSWSQRLRQCSFETKKSRRMRWLGHVVHMGEERGAQGVGGEARRKEAIGETQT